MTASNAIKAYDDCFNLLEQAQADELGVRVEMKSESEASAYRLRLHYARKLDRKRNAAIYADPEHPSHGASDHDNIVCRIKNVDGRVFLYLEKTSSPPTAEPLSGVQIEYKEIKQIEHLDTPRLIESIRRRI